MCFWLVLPNGKHCLQTKLSKNGYPVEGYPFLHQFVIFLTSRRITYAVGSKKMPFFTILVLCRKGAIMVQERMEIIYLLCAMDLFLRSLLFCLVS